MKRLDLPVPAPDKPPHDKISLAAGSLLAALAAAAQTFVGSSRIVGPAAQRQRRAGATGAVRQGHACLAQPGPRLVLATARAGIVLAAENCARGFPRCARAARIALRTT